MQQTVFKQLMIVQWFLSDLIKKYHREYLTAQADLATLVSESANMQEIIKSLNAEDWVIHRFTDAAHRQKMMKRGEVRVQTVLVPINILCTYLPLIVLIIVGGIMVQWGNLSLGALLSFIVLGQIVSDIMSDLAGFVTYVRRLEVVTTRILDWWNIPQENWCFSSQQKQAEQIESVSFEDLAFAYEDSMQILKGITARAYRGDKIAVLGPSGSGKSTLLAILSSLEFPAKGEVKYNDRLFSNWDTSSLRGEIVYVEQQPYFFRGTVRENIECGIKYSEEEIKKCLYISDAYDFVAALPQGLNTIIGEKGVDLSGGEKQRLAITRALLKNASLLLLDEATSALDHNSEVKVINGLLSLKNNPIILFVTHKTNLAGMFDKRWVIEEGNLKEEIK